MPVFLFLVLSEFFQSTARPQ